MKISSSVAREVGDSYFFATHRVGCETDIVISCDLLCDVDLRNAVSAFEQLVRLCPLLQFVKTWRKEGGAWTWVAGSEGEWFSTATLIAQELLGGGSSTTGSLCAVGSIPFRLTRCLPQSLEFRVDHTFANGRSGYWWVEQYFRVLAGIAPENDALDHDVSEGSLVPLQLTRAIKHSFVSFVKRCIAGGIRKDIRGQVLRNHRANELKYVYERFVLSREQIEKVVNSDRLKDESYTQVISRKLLEQAFLECELSIIGIQIAVDLHDHFGLRHQEIGNFTGLISGYIRGAGNIGDEVGILFDAMRNGATLGFTKLLSFSQRTTKKMTSWLANQFRLVLFGRGALMMDHLFLISNLGQVAGDYTRRSVRAISLRTTTPHVYLSLSTINDSTTIEISYSSSIYDEVIVRNVISQFIERLHGY